ncbi:hypothetical protein MC885_012493 [Smutsia gigantea]|nr:hypothetical protein MC885_012493 [Smutsia gigantea]
MGPPAPVLGPDRTHTHPYFPAGSKRKKGGSSFLTISSFYREQLNTLMTTLHGTSPLSSIVLSPTCFLSCRLGNDDDCHHLSPIRCQVLNPRVIPLGLTDKEASELLLGSTDLDVNTKSDTPRGDKGTD